MFVDDVTIADPPQLISRFPRPPRHPHVQWPLSSRKWPWNVSSLNSSHFSSSFLSHPFFCFWIDKYGQLYVRIDVISLSSLSLFLDWQIWSTICQNWYGYLNISQNGFPHFFLINTINILDFHRRFKGHSSHVHWTCLSYSDQPRTPSTTDVQFLGHPHSATRAIGTTKKNTPTYKELRNVATCQDRNMHSIAPTLGESCHWCWRQWCIHGKWRSLRDLGTHSFKDYRRKHDFSDAMKSEYNQHLAAPMASRITSNSANAFFSSGNCKTLEVPWKFWYAIANCLPSLTFEVLPKKDASQLQTSPPRNRKIQNSNFTSFHKSGVFSPPIPQQQPAAFLFNIQVTLSRRKVPVAGAQARTLEPLGLTRCLHETLG